MKIFLQFLSRKGGFERFARKFPENIGDNALGAFILITVLSFFGGRILHPQMDPDSILTVMVSKV